MRILYFSSKIMHALFFTTNWKRTLLDTVFLEQIAKRAKLQMWKRRDSHLLIIKIWKVLQDHLRFSWYNRKSCLVYICSSALFAICSSFEIFDGFSSIVRPFRLCLSVISQLSSFDWKIVLKLNLLIDFPFFLFFSSFGLNFFHLLSIFGHPNVTLQQQSKTMN